MKNRRETKRLHLNLVSLVEAVDDGGYSERGDYPMVDFRDYLVTKDISCGGAYFRTLKPLGKGTVVKMELLLPIVNRAGKKTKDMSRTAMRGRVVRTEYGGMAVEFEESCPDLSLLEG